MSDENFLARWSQRKRQIAREAEKQADEAPATPAPKGQEPAEPVDLSLLPNIEDLTDASDITAFLKKGVPESLRNAALRRAWAVDPMVRDYVGDALDYAWDWNVVGGVPGSGELQAGTDLARMVSQVFGDAPETRDEKSSQADENVNNDVATQDAAMVTPAVPELSKSTDVAPQVQDSLPQVDADSAAVIDAERRSSDHDAVQQKTRRHGGALPAV